MKKYLKKLLIIGFSFTFVLSAFAFSSCRDDEDNGVVVPLPQLATPQSVELVSDVLWWSGNDNATNGFLVSLNDNSIVVSVNQLRLNDYLHYLVGGENVVRIQARATSTHRASNFSNPFRWVRGYQDLPSATQAEWTRIVNQTIAEFEILNNNTNYLVTMRETIRSDDMDMLLPFVLNSILELDGGDFEEMIEAVINMLPDFGIDVSALNLGTHSIYGRGNATRNGFELNAQIDDMLNSQALIFAQLIFPQIAEVVDGINNTIRDINNNTFSVVYNDYLIAIERMENDSEINEQLFGMGLSRRQFLGHSIAVPQNVGHPLGATIALMQDEVEVDTTELFDEFANELRNLENFTQTGSFLVATSEALENINNSAVSIIELLLTTVGGGVFGDVFENVQGTTELVNLTLGHTQNNVSSINLTIDFVANARDLLQFLDLDNEEINDIMANWGDRDEEIKMSIDFEIGLTFGRTSVIGLPERNNIWKQGIDIFLTPSVISKD
ncbi:MAG: hypothetical protein FWC11_01560 [Firmicutes bacterium]|nr:hypothetical protein [Bacillota bacterium]MCL2255528.1 hypothetical protein [Bacillota bacterium]